MCHRLPSHENNERAVENQTIAVFDSDETRPQSSPVNFGRPGMFVDLACACFREAEHVRDQHFKNEISMRI